MRFLTVLLALALVTALDAQAPGGATSGRRYGIEPDLEIYPQSNPKEGLGSVLKAIEQGRIDYLLAQLADPQFVDDRVKMHGGSFDEVVKETTTKFSQDPTAVKELQRILREGEWQEGDAEASAHLKDRERTVFLRKVGQRWFLENRQKGEAKPPKDEPGKP